MNLKIFILRTIINIMPKLYPLNIKHLHNSIIVSCLGEGTFGNVKLYKCKEKNLSDTGEFLECNKCFVVKQIKKKKHYFWDFDKTKTEDSKIKKALLNEYAIGSLLHHPNIRETLDIDLIDNCIIFEYCNGNTLFDYIINNKIDFFKDKILQDYFTQIIRAIEYIHNNNVAHLDLKLENIMITDNVIKIIDFGEACCLNNKITGIHGTTPYIAPEEFNLEYFDGTKVDIWALGIILYEMIYKSFPWEIAKVKNIRYNKFCTLYNNDNLNIFFPNSSIDIIKLFKKMLNPNPDKRCNINDIKLNDII
jgi:protein-serine/threonine kinase